MSLNFLLYHKQLLVFSCLKWLHRFEILLLPISNVLGPIMTVKQIISIVIFQKTSRRCVSEHNKQDDSLPEV